MRLEPGPISRLVPRAPQRAQAKVMRSVLLAMPHTQPMDTWTCHCGQFTREVEPGVKQIGYVPPIEEGATTYWFHGTHECHETSIPEQLAEVDQPSSTPSEP